MNDFTKLLKRIIAHETKYVETMRHSLKEDELTILRLQNKSRGIEKEIEERKLLILEYRGYLRGISEATQTRINLVPPTKHQMDTNSSTTHTEVTNILDKQI